MIRKRSTNEKLFMRQLAIMLIYVIISIFLLSIAIGILTGHRKSLFGYTARVVVSGSMEPSIKTNSISIIKLCDIKDIHVNDVVCFNYSQDVVHRVIEIKTNEDGDIILHTKGDANEKADEVEGYNEMIIGKVVKTFNGVSGLIEKHSISPGNIDTLALSRDLTAKILLVGITALIIAWIFDIAKILIKSFSKKNNGYQEEIDKYIEDINELILYRDILKELKEYEIENSAETRFRYIMNSISRAKAEYEVDKIHSSIKHFKKQIKHCLWLNKIGVKIDNDTSAENKDKEQKKE